MPKSKPSNLPLTCILALDISASMEPIQGMYEGVLGFVQSALQRDSLREGLRLGVVTIGEEVALVCPPISLDQVQLPPLHAAGQTPLAEGLNQALDALPEGRGWIVLITDAVPYFGDSLFPIKQRLFEGYQADRLTLLALGVNDADMQVLQELAAPNRPPLRLYEFQFEGFFAWLVGLLEVAMQPNSEASVETLWNQNQAFLSTIQ